MLGHRSPLQGLSPKAGAPENPHVRAPIATIKGLFETHLTVRSLERSIAFYRDVLGLPLAIQIPDRKVAFFWVPAAGAGMLGLWEVGTSPNFMRLHIAFTVDLDNVEAAIARIEAHGLQADDGGPMTEPYVFAWMPAAQVSLLDPDGHSIELIAMLPDAPHPELGRIRLSEWRALQDNGR